MNRVEFLKKVRLIADEPIWLHRSNMTSDLITEMQEVFDRLEELEMREDRNDYLTKQLHIQRQINYELEYNLGDEKYLEQHLVVVRSKKAEAKKALNAMFGGCTPEDFPIPDVDLNERVKAQQAADRAIANLHFIQAQNRKDQEEGGE